MKLNDKFKNEQYKEAYEFAEQNNYLLKYLGFGEDGEPEYQIVERDIEQENKNALSAKLSRLESWFNNYFDKQLTQSLWQDDFEVSHDDYFDKDYEGIQELKAQAEVVRQEIKELRNNIGG